MSRKNLEVRVGVENWNIRSDGDCRDQAVDQLSRCLTASPADPIERRRLLIVDRLGCQERASSKQSPEVCEMSIVTGTGEDLHPYRVAHGDFRPEEFFNPIAGRASGVPQKLDPRRGVDQNHETRLERSSPRSPSHPEPRRARASSMVSASAASKRNARLTASRFVDRW